VYSLAGIFRAHVRAAIPLNLGGPIENHRRATRVQKPKRGARTTCFSLKTVKILRDRRTSSVVPNSALDRHDDDRDSIRTSTFARMTAREFRKSKNLLSAVFSCIRNFGRVPSTFAYNTRRFRRQLGNFSAQLRIKLRTYRYIFTAYTFRYIRPYIEPLLTYR